MVELDDVIKYQNVPAMVNVVCAVHIHVFRIYAQEYMVYVSIY